ncbi:MAG: phenylacetate-CoA ligase [Rhodothermales bacterium]|jgi:phenylacetate-CoA ligase
MESWSWPPSYDDAYKPAADVEYWFPHRETMDPEQRDEKILERIQSIMHYCHEHSPFYRRKWSKDGLEPGDIKTLQDFEKVPVITKEELRQSQIESPPFGDYLCIPKNQVARLHGTSGTTGRPTAFGIGPEDWRSISNAHARVMWSMGIRPNDTVFIGSVFSLYMGSWAALAGTERLGAAAFPFGAGISGQTLRGVNWMLQMKPSVFYGTPSYALRLAEVAIENGIDPHDFGIRILFFSGEPGASIPSIRKKIESAYGGKVFDSGSMAEMSPWTNLAETKAHAGMLCWQDIVYTEVVDPDTCLRVPYGSEGTPVYTHLERTSQPMIRLLSGDLTRWEAGPSPCGRTYPILPRGIYGRIDDQFTIRGENIIPSAIDEILSAEKLYSGEHRIIISREDTMDTLVVQAEYAKEIAGNLKAIDTLRHTLETKLRTALGVRAEVQMVPTNTFERTEFKARRVIDRRDLFNEILESA